MLRSQRPNARMGYFVAAKKSPLHVEARHIRFHIRFSSLPNIHRRKSLTAVLLEFPISVVEGADLTRLQPTGNAVEVEGVLFQGQLWSGR